MKNHRCTSTIRTNDPHSQNSSTIQNHQPIIHRPPYTIKHLNMMKLRIPTRSLPSNPNPNRPLFSNTLYIRHNHSIFISHPYLPRCKLRMINSLYPCKRGLNILHMPIPTCRSWPILWLLLIPRNLKHRSNPPISHYSNRIHGLCPPMRTNIILRRHRNHKSTISYPIYWNRPSRMNLRRILSG